MPKLAYNKKYVLKDGEVVPGVTTVIKNNLGWGQQALMGWVAKVTKEGKDFRKTTQEAADAGTLAHALVEHHIAGSELDPNILSSYSDEQVREAKNAFNAFLVWKEQSKLEIIGSEVRLLSEWYRYGGTVDLILKDKDGGIHIADVKTTNFLLPDHLIQIAAYAMAFTEMHNVGEVPVAGIAASSKVVGGHLLRFNKGDAVAFHYAFWSEKSLESGFDAFKALLTLNSLKKGIESVC